MKKLKNIITVLFIALEFALQANWPGSTSFLIKDKGVSNYKVVNNTIAWKKTKGIDKMSFVSPSFTNVNSGYITGNTKTEESTISRVLHWDFKVKFRLSRNMNIIFSYN